MVAQSGFGFFFVAILVGCTFALWRWVQLNWQKISRAIRGETADGERLVRYRAAQCRPMDIPYVAQRMLAEPVAVPISASAVNAAWLRRPLRPSARQMGFGF
jgi:hypothetical protein